MDWDPVNSFKLKSSSLDAGHKPSKIQQGPQYFNSSALQNCNFGIGAIIFCLRIHQPKIDPFLALPPKSQGSTRSVHGPSCSSQSLSPHCPHPTSPSVVEAPTPWRDAGAAWDSSTATVVGFLDTIQIPLPGGRVWIGQVKFPKGITVINGHFSHFLWNARWIRAILKMIEGCETEWKATRPWSRSQHQQTYLAAANSRQRMSFQMGRHRKPSAQLQAFPDLHMALRTPSMHGGEQQKLHQIVDMLLNFRAQSLQNDSTISTNKLKNSITSQLW